MKTNKLKLIIMLPLLILLSGCTVDYNLEIKNDTATETVNFTKPNSEYSTSDINSELGLLIGFNKDETNSYAFYNMNKIIGDSESGLTFSYDFKANTFTYQSTFISSCYDSVNFKYTDIIISLTTSKTFKCWDANLNSAFKINIKTDLTVTNNNADNHSGNIYTWNMDPSITDKPIVIELLRDTANSNNQTNNSLSETLPVVFIAIGVIIIGGMTYFIINKIQNNNNKI